MDRRAILAIVAAVAVLSAAVGWIAGQRIKSPAEIAAEQEPPPPSLITVPVELRTLSQSVVVRGTVRPSDETAITAPAVEGSTIITRLPLNAGDQVTEGDVLFDVAGRPVIALEGTLPTFRNLIPGLVGPDVLQLEQALLRLGHDPGVIDETYTGATSTAVEALYRDAGYVAAETDGGVQASLDGAESAVDAQEAVLADAEEALATAQEPVPGYERDSLDLAVARAESALTAARKLVTTIADAERKRTAAAAASATADSRLEQARAGIHPDTGQPPTEAELAELEAEAADAAADLDAADAALADARGQLSEPTPALHVKAAEINLEQVKAERSERLNPPDLASLRAAVEDAKSSLKEAQEDLTEAQADVGAWIPDGEIVFFTSLPRQVKTMLVEVGDTASGSVMTVSGPDTVIDSGVAAADRRLIEIGAEAVIEDDDLGISIGAVVTFLADTPGGGGLSADRYAMRLDPTSEVPDDAINVNLRVAIPITSSGGDVLAVPLAALSAGADGTARVEVERASGITELVEVSTGLRAGGFVEIDPLELPLEAGDRVVVGRNIELPSASGADGGETDGTDVTDGDAEDEGGS